MTILISYLIKLSISLAVVYLFYQLVLRRLTFYNWNRWYLMIYSIIAFLIPVINVYPVLERNNWSDNGMLGLIPTVSYQIDPNSLVYEEESKPWTYQQWTLIFITIGVGIMLIRLIIQQISYFRIKRASKLIIDDTVKVYQVDKDIIPFSYGNSIFVNQHQHDSEELKEIIRHEFIHVKQRHTLDILWSECLCILNWYNPFAWLIRKSIRQNLEFIADNKVLENGIDKKQYQYLLLKVVGVSQFNIATQFNFRSLKKRIAMMNKIRSAKLHLIKFLFLLPLMAVLLLAFRNNIDNGPLESNDPHNFITDTVNKPSIDTIAWISEDGSVRVGDLSKLEAKDINGNQFLLLLNGEAVSTFSDVNKSTIVFFKTYLGREARKKFGEKGKYGVHEMITLSAPSSMLDTIPAKKKEHRDLHISIRNNIATVKQKNGSTETYDLNKKEEKQAYIDKYGELPAPPPPPVEPRPGTPPAPPAAPAHRDTEAPVHPAKPHTPTPPPPPNKKGYVITVADNNGECVVIVKDKNNKIVKAETLNEWNKEESVNTAKYGEIPPAPPAKAIGAAKTVPGEITVVGYGIKKSSAAKSAVKPANAEVPAPGIDHGVIIAPTNERLYSGESKPVKANIITVRGKQALTGRNEDVLYIIDGEKQPIGSTTLNNIEPNSIHQIDVLKDASAISVYGEEGKNGVISITTKKAHLAKIGSDAVTLRADNFTLHNLSNFKGLILVDGKEYTAKGFQELDMATDKIESITVWKGEDAVKRFGDKAKEGAIEINTKKPVTLQLKLSEKDQGTSKLFSRLME